MNLHTKMDLTYFSFLHNSKKAKTYYYILIFISSRSIFLSAKISYIEKPIQTSNTTYCVGQFQVMCCFII